VPSPTYTLVEPYALGGWQVYHVDLYRLDEPRDVEQLGLGELARPGRLLLIEWPDRGAGHLPPADLEIALSMAQAGRRIRLTPHGAGASTAIGRLSASNPL
jgi:tRNA threonylcarbamoyladenosine biosynthesis protein TsaE